MRPFVSKPHNYATNIMEGSTIAALPAWLTAPDGREPGIIIRAGYQIRAVIPTADALRLANEIVDAVEKLERGAVA